jgi:hypothetical protein
MASQNDREVDFMAKIAVGRRALGGLIIFITVLSFSLFPASQMALGQATGWSQPLMLSSKRQSSTFPEIVTDSTGRVHVFWGS